MLYLKQSAAVTIILGPFLDAGDGVTPETGLVTAMDTATTGIRISKNAAAYSDKNSATATVHREAGEYAVHLDATDTGTLGHLRVQYDDSTTCTPAWENFTVVASNVYDSLFGAATDKLQVDVQEWLGTAAATPTVAGVPEIDVTHWLGTAAATPATAGTPSVDIVTISGSITAADNLEEGALAVITGQCSGTPTAISIDTNLESAGYTTDNALIGRIIIFDGNGVAALKGQAASITGYNASTGNGTISLAAAAITTAPNSSDTFQIV